MPPRAGGSRGQPVQTPMGDTHVPNQTERPESTWRLEPSRSHGPGRDRKAPAQLRGHRSDVRRDLRDARAARAADRKREPRTDFGVRHMSDPAVTAEQAQASYRALEASIAEQLSGAETAEPYVPAIADPGEDLIEVRHGLDVATIALANARAEVDLCRGHLSEAESELATAARAVE